MIMKFYDIKIGQSRMANLEVVFDTHFGLKHNNRMAWL